MAKRTFLEGLIEARQRQANRYVNGYLATLGTDTLTNAGLDRKTLRKSGSTVFPY